jgi:ribosomal-protein-alanine N-acetyltransferase
MKQLRRLDVPAVRSPYQKLQRGVLRNVRLNESQLRTLERERPELVVVDGEAVMVGWLRRRLVDLHYAFLDRDEFVRRFPSMFARLLDGVQPSEAPLGFRLTLVDRPSRPYVEPVLLAHAFEVNREWMEMVLADLPEQELAGDEIASGFLLRDVEDGDAEAIVRLEDMVFPAPALTVDEIRQARHTTAFYRVLEEKATRAVAGSLLGDVRPASTGHIGTLAVHPDYQRRGLGEAMLRWALAWFRQQGLRRAELTVTIDSAPAIALYRKLGFAPATIGLDYRRPIDEDEVRRVLEKRRGSLIKFGGWR